MGILTQEGSPSLICAILVKAFFPYSSLFNRKILAVPYSIGFTHMFLDFFLPSRDLQCIKCNCKVSFLFSIF